MNDKLLEDIKWWFDVNDLGDLIRISWTIFVFSLFIGALLGIIK